MDASLQRRVSVASYWASTRIAVLDSFESYEDSYAITQEFCEWITCTRDYPEHLEASVLKVPNLPNRPIKEQAGDTDEVLEI